MVEVFNKLIYPLMEYIKCTQNKMEDLEYSLFIVDPKEIEEKNREVQICDEDITFKDKNCAKLCKINLSGENVKLKFFRNYKQALKSKDWNLNIKFISVDFFSFQIIRHKVK